MLTFPVNCDTPRRRTEYCYRAEELLRLLHNVIGTWYREGITETKWDKLPEKIKNRYPYKPQLSADEWVEFKYNVFNPISARISKGITSNRWLLRESTEWTINVEDI